jgi:hypothetical protein
MSLGKKMMPRFAIANNFAFGSPPECLLEFTEVELAMLTPVKTYGYCFSYTKKNVGWKNWLKERKEVQTN